MKKLLFLIISISIYFHINGNCPQDEICQYEVISIDESGAASVEYKLGRCDKNQCKPCI